MSSTIIQNGGLGNQMFIYSLYYAMKKKGCQVKIDASLYHFLKMHNGYEISRVFGVDQPEVDKTGLHVQALRLLLHFKPKCLILDEPLPLFMDVFKTKAPYITGYWQSDHYFKDVKEDLLRIYTFKNISERNKSIAYKMQQYNSVSLHIRRGDYLKVKGAMSICTEDYYFKAISIICSKVENPHYYIFSNDIEWSNNFAKKLGVNYTVVDHNSGYDSYQDMYLMTQCKHNILANSSFSWWGAYLNQHKDAIRIAPQIWCIGHSEERLKIDTPENWLRI